MKKGATIIVESTGNVFYVISEFGERYGVAEKAGWW